MVPGPGVLDRHSLGLAMINSNPTVCYRKRSSSTRTAHIAEQQQQHIRWLLPKRPIKELGPLNQSAVQISIGPALDEK